MSTLSPPGTPVLVVGAGPTGLMLALQLAARGVKPLIIDRHAGPARETRALAVHARTLEIYAHAAVVDRALELGSRATAADLWAAGSKRARLPLGDIGKGLSPYPYILILGQDDNERILGEAVRRHGIEVSWNTELVGLRQGENEVTAELKDSDGTLRTLRADWVAGCDGAHSAVRHLNGIGFPGAPYEHVFFVADVEATGPMAPAEINIYLWRKGFHLLFPMRGVDHWRVVGILPPAMRERENLTFEEVAPAVRAEAGADLQFRHCTWFSKYRIHHRRAERFRSGRCFLLGDAAHIHSPVGGQGMNTGLQDAYNLGWKLASVVLGTSAAALLDTYAAEREPVADRLLQTTDRAFSIIVADNWLAGLFRTRFLARMAAMAMRLSRVRRLAFRTISQIGISYRASPLSLTLPGWPDAAPQAGDRMPWCRIKYEADTAPRDIFGVLDDSHFHLLEFGDAKVGIPADRRILVHRIPDTAENRAEWARVGIPQPAMLLVRPDGHIGMAGSPISQRDLERYMRDRIGVPPA